MKIKISNSERVVFVGTTGSGKTELAKHFLPRLNRVLVIDPKHEFKLDGFKRVKNLPMFGKEFKIIFRPKLSDDEQLADMIYKLFREKNCTIYCDELMTLTEMFPASLSVLTDVVRTGREKHVAVWSAFQRPRWVPRFYMSESEVKFQFNLLSFEDRVYMSQFSTPLATEKIERFTFWYMRPDMDEPALMRLNLPKNYIETI